MKFDHLRGTPGSRNRLAAQVWEGARVEADPAVVPELADVDERAISAQFGDDFARAVLALSPGGWHGPVASSFGLHLVRVGARQEARARPFEAVREKLVAEWHRRRDDKAKADYFAGLLRKYDVQVSEGVRPLHGSALDALREPPK